MSRVHKVFLSYYHELDQARKNVFELRFGNKYGAIISGSVNDGDIDPMLATETTRQKIRDLYLRDTSVTIVLVGELTWQRKHVDWEISSSIRHTEYNPRSGLLGILLPAYSDKYFKGDTTKYDPHTIPPRLADNLASGFATLHSWNENADVVQEWVHSAYLRKSRIIPDNGRPLFAKNRTGSRWEY
ncbi:MAG: TIR domain-containing protein [Planctomycetes bacterium]|nr:TIR domain-containing protein [Planctomycetota bacterium]MCW8134428.1 TIR domain-containing protein [Planctomycetota bacterium]